ncbi:histidine kinase [Sinomicrobium sp.]
MKFYTMVMKDQSVAAFTISDSMGVFFCGAITLLLFIIFVVYLKTSERIYLYYSLFLLFSLFYGFAMLRDISGFDNLVLNYLRGKTRYIEPFTILSFSCYIFFAIALVNIRRQNRILSRQLHVFGMVAVIYSLLYFVFYPYIASHHLFIFVGTRILIFSLCSYFLYRIYRKIQSPVKGFFIAGSLFYLVGSVIASVRYSDLEVPFRAFYDLSSTSYFQLGILFQALFFALALGERVVFLHQEHDRGQRVLIEQLSVQERVVSEANRQLEEEIQLRVNEIIAIKEDLQEQERKRLAAEYERNLIRSEIQAKQAQINPHFIFNNLNAIKYLILQQESGKAIKYLVRFSRFIRAVLDRAEEDIIPLERELMMVYDYLELEKKRFNDDFTFRIENHIDNSGCYIPPLLLLPFIENAIWHGLLTSEKEEKQLLITVGNTCPGIKITIEDNGVGRDRILSGTSGKIQGSMGIPLTRERIRLFNHNNNDKKITLNIVDLKDEYNNALGTRVELLLDFYEKPE